MTTDQNTALVVTQEDRDAANGVLYCAIDGTFTAEGQFKLDMGLVALAFAKHRLSALRPGAGAEAELVERLRDIVTCGCDGDKAAEIGRLAADALTRQAAELAKTEEWAREQHAAADRYASELRALRAERECTCHPDDRPSGDCPKKFAATECQAEALRAGEGERKAIVAWLRAKADAEPAWGRFEAHRYLKLADAIERGDHTELRAGAPVSPPSSGDGYAILRELADTELERLRLEIAICEEAISEGASDAWWAEDLSRARHKKDLLEGEVASLSPVPATPGEGE